MTPRRGSREQYQEFGATELYCPRCRASMPVRRRLLLVLPEGDKYEYACSRCGTSLATQLDRDPNRGRILIP
ncbi:MAG: cytoplasmic protein [bacterium]